MSCNLIKNKATYKLFAEKLYVIYIYIYIYILHIMWMTIYICSPTPVGLSSLANEVIVLPLAYMQGSSYESSSR